MAIVDRDLVYGPGPWPSNTAATRPISAAMSSLASRYHLVSDTVLPEGWPTSFPQISFLWDTSTCIQYQIAYETMIQNISSPLIMTPFRAHLGYLGNPSDLEGQEIFLRVKRDTMSHPHFSCFYDPQPGTWIHTIYTSRLADLATSSRCPHCRIPLPVRRDNAPHLPQWRSKSS